MVSVRRITPLDQQTVATIGSDLGGLPDSLAVLFPTGAGTRMSTDAVAKRLDLHITAAAASCPTLGAKNITPHTLRHYVDAWVMWRATVFPLVSASRGSAAAT